MTGSVRIALLFVAFHLVAAGSATASGFDPANSECPGPAIKVVGHDGTVGDPLGEYCVTIRDFNNTPVVNTDVVIDFSHCDIELCIDQKDPNVIVDCVSQTVRKLTDANGVACFRVIGKHRDVDCTAKPSPCVEVFAVKGTFICALYAPVYDLVNEAGGLSGTDLSQFLHLFFDCGVYLSAIDYNANNEVDGDDLSQFLIAFFRGGSALNCPPAAKCP